MKELGLLLFCFTMSVAATPEDDETLAAKQTEHQQGSERIADVQDELSADVQQLIIEQTLEPVIELLNQVDTIMDEATDRLANQDTGGETIAAQTEVIEKIHAAAKEKQKQQGSGKSGGAMMDMLERMMGKNPDGEGKGKDQKGNKPGNQAGQGQTGLSDSANTLVDGNSSGKDETRRVPKAAGSAGQALPQEFQKILDAYNRGLEQKLK